MSQPIANAEKVKKPKAEKVPKATAEDHQQFLNDNDSHWLLQSLKSSGNMKANKSGISVTATPLSFWANLINNTRDATGYTPRKLQLVLDDQIIFEQTI